MNTIREDEAIKIAREEYACDEIEIDLHPKTSSSEEGTWVAAWVWVAYMETGPSKAEVGVENVG